MSTPQRISSTAQRCRSAFQKIRLSELVSDDTRDWAEDQGARFRAWATTLGVFARGRMSVAYRLQLNAPLVIVILQLLDGIENCLKRLLPTIELRPMKTLLVTGTHEFVKKSARSYIGLLLRIAYDLRKLGNTKEEQRALEYDPVDENDSSLVTAFEQYTRCLCYVHLTRSRAAVLSTLNKDSISTKDDRSQLPEHSQEKQGEAIHSFLIGLKNSTEGIAKQPSFIQQRLHTTILQRWRLLCYRSHHAQGLAGEDEQANLPDLPESDGQNCHQNGAPAQPTNVVAATPPSETVTPQSTGPVSAATIVTAEHPLPILSEAEKAPKSVITKSGIALRAMDFPRAPQIELEDIVCPICYIPFASSEFEGEAWKSHVLRDLAPYICVFEDCPNPYARYPTSGLLKQHLENVHVDLVWRCPECAKAANPTDPVQFTDSKSFIMHLEDAHEVSIGVDDVQFILKHAAFRKPQTLQACVFCGGFARSESETGSSHWSNLVRHMTHEHMQSLAMLSLPWHLQERSDTSCTSSEFVENGESFDEEELVDTDERAGETDTGTPNNDCETVSTREQFMDPDEHNDMWPAKIHQYWNSLGLSEQTLLTSEDKYGDALKVLCTAHKEHNATALLSRIIRQRSPILSITNGLDTVNDHGAPGTLTALVLGVSKIAIQTALKAKLKLAEVVKATQLLDSQVPVLNRENLRMYQSNTAVRRPLQSLLLCYMDAYITIFSQSAPSVLDLEQFKRDIDGKDVFFKEQQAIWEGAFEQARKEEQDRIALGRGTIGGAVGDPPHSRQISEARFDFVIELGSGRFGQVCLVQEHQTGVFFARKFISAPLATTDSGRRKRFKAMVLNEADITRKLQHHHIASMLLYIEADDGFSLIMSTVGDCNLHNFLQESCIKANFPRKEIKLLDHWFGCLVSALAFAHTNRVKHENLKPSNILIKEDRVYLADFGCATDFEQEPSSISGDDWKGGTPVYWPPEPLKERGRAADVFALGCVFSEMLTVRQGRTLDGYMSQRQVEDHENPYRFSKNLPAVQSWLIALPNVNNDIPSLLLEAILIMLHEKADERKDAKALKRLFRVEGEGLFCESCA